MKAAIIIHLKAKSTRLKKKNFKKISNKPLYKITFDKVKKLRKSFDIYIDSSSQIFENEAKNEGNRVGMIVGITPNLNSPPT